MSSDVSPSTAIALARYSVAIFHSSRAALDVPALRAFAAAHLCQLDQLLVGLHSGRVISFEPPLVEAGAIYRARLFLSRWSCVEIFAISRIST
jgi:hypothetical protein